MKTTKELLTSFPQLGFNLDNIEINNKYSMLIETMSEREITLTEKNVRFHVRDFFKKEFGITFPNVNKNSPKFWFARGYTEDESKIKAREFYDTKIKGKRLLPTQVEYYLNKGMNEKDAKEALTKEQKKRADKLISKEKATPELRNRRLWNQTEYWVNKGYTQEQGQQLINEKYESINHQTFKKLVQKYIDRGDDETTATNKATKFYKTKAQQIMQTRIKNNSFGFQKASQMSLNFFKPLMEKLDQQGIEYYVGVEGNAEFFLASGTEYFYSYDFCIPSQKLIIEFHGEHVHPNPKMTKEQWDAWVHCWSRKSADDCREEDVKKIELAESKGFKVIEVFESDTIKILDLV